MRMAWRVLMRVFGASAVGTVAWVAPAVAADYYLHTEASDTLDQAAPTSTSANLRDSPPVNRTTYQTIGTWTTAPQGGGLTVTSVGDVRIWVGLKNSDDQGTWFDVRAELRKNDSLIASGESKTVKGVTRNPAQAKEVVVTLTLPAAAGSSLAPGDVLSLRLLAKVADSGGHASAVGLRAYYDGVTRAARVGVTLAPQGFQVAITSPPPPPATVPAGLVLVRGTIAGVPEAGVTVNGFPMAVESGSFTGSALVGPDDAELVALATTPDGRTAEARSLLSVAAAAAEESLTLLAKPASGPAPHTVRLVLAGANAEGEVALDVEGDGTPDILDPDFDTRTFRYDAPGFYFPTVTVTGSDGVARSARAMIQVIDAGVLDVQLKARWQAMKDALRAGQVAQALDTIALQARSVYAELLPALTLPLGQIDQLLGDIRQVSVEGDRAEYEMRRLEEGTELSYLVLFVRDEDGVWRIKFF